jgi:hypothetical protein
MMLLPHGAAAEKSCHEQPVRWTVSSFSRAPHETVATNPLAGSAM